MKLSVANIQMSHSVSESLSLFNTVHVYIMSTLIVQVYIQHFISTNNCLPTEEAYIIII